MSTTQVPPHFVQVSGENFVLNGQRAAFRGMNLGNWLLVESYMIGLPWTEYRMRRAFHEGLGDERARAFWDAFCDAYVQEADVAWMAGQGYNFVQLPLNYGFFTTTNRRRYFPQDAYALIDRFLGWADRYGIKVLLGLHAAPGAQARDWNAESDFGEAFFWEEEFHLQETERIWADLARHYRHDARIFGYELINEPVCADRVTFTRYHRRLIEAVRREDPDHIIALSGNNWNKDLHELDAELFADPQTIPSLHYYTAVQPPWRELREFPTTWQGRPAGREELLADFQRMHDARPVARPVIIGEFGTATGDVGLLPGYDPAEGAHREMNQELVRYWNSRGLSWTYWAHKDLRILGSLNPRPDTAWARLVFDPELVRLRTEYGKAAKALADDLKASLPAVGEDERFVLLHQCRHHWDSIMLPHFIRRLGDKTEAELVELARSWAFENCVERPLVKGLFDPRA